MDYVIVAVVALLAVLVATPLSRKVAAAVGAVDQPGGRRVHATATPRLGGVAMLFALFAAVAVASRLSTFDEVFSGTSDPEAIVLAACVICAIGIADDVRQLSAPAKLAGQILAAGTVVLFGVELRYVYVPGDVGTVVLSPDVATLVTIVAIVAMINAINLVDGIDGLAAGVTGIAAIAMFSYVVMAPPELGHGLTASATMMLAVLVGVCAGFLVFNSHPASVFMGDSGAMLIGLLLASSSVLAVGGTIQPSGRDFAALSVPILVPVLVLSVPFLDTATTIARRLLTGRAVFSPDKKHLHHRLIEIGHSHRRAVLIMYYWSALFAFAAVGIGLLPLPQVLTVVGVGAVLGIGVLWLTRARGKHAALRVEQPRGHVQNFTNSGPESDRTPSDQQKHRSRQL